MQDKCSLIIYYATKIISVAKKEIIDYIITDVPPSSNSFSWYNILAFLHEAEITFCFAFLVFIPIMIFILYKLLRKKIIKDKITHYQEDRQKEKRISKNSEISSVEDFRKFNQDFELQQDITHFKYLIENEIDMIDDTPPELRPFYMKKLKELSELDLQDREDLDYAEFLFNGGNLRTDEEIFEYNKALFGKEYSKSGKYDALRHSVNILSFLIPFLITFCIIGLSIPDLFDVWFIGVPIVLVPSLFVGVIGMLIGYRHNIKQAATLGIPDSDTSVIKEKRKLVIGLTSGFLAIRRGVRKKRNLLKTQQN